jgi:hypothetical protein
VELAFQHGCTDFLKGGSELENLASFLDAVLLYDSARIASINHHLLAIERPLSGHVAKVLMHLKASRLFQN